MLELIQTIVVEQCNQSAGGKVAATWVCNYYLAQRLDTVTPVSGPLVNPPSIAIYYHSFQL